MKKTIAFSLMVLAGANHLAYAEGLTLQTQSGRELGLEVSSYRYAEETDGQPFMSTSGPKLGLTGSIIHAAGNDWHIRGDARFASGAVDYESASSGSKGGNPDYTWELRLLGGKDFPLTHQLLVPYAGVGYRTLFNDLRGYTSTGHAGYRRQSEYLYLPLGLTHRFISTDGARISTTLEYDHLIEGTQRSQLSDATLGMSDPINTQKNGYGIRLSSHYEMRDWSIGAFYHHWSIQDSDVQAITLNGAPYGTGMEPKNTTREIGIQFKRRFD